MLTGRQLKAARALLGLPRSKLAERMSMSRVIVKIAESDDGERPITVARARQIQSHLERQGIKFMDGDDGPTARLADRDLSSVRPSPSCCATAP